MNRKLQAGYCVPAFAFPGHGLFRTPNVQKVSAKDVLGGAQRAEALGFDSIWVCDHLMVGSGHEVLEGWTTLAAIAGATRVARLGLIHQANLFRNPAIAAKMMATLDFLSDGRFVHFFEAGMQRAEHVAYGLDWTEDHDVRLQQMAEAIDLIQLLYDADTPVDFDGKFYQLKQALLAPKPVQPRPPLWLGGDFQSVIDMTARVAGGWNSTPATPAELAQRLSQLDIALERAGRPRAEIEISFETQILVAPDLSTLRTKLGRMLELAEQADAEPADTAIVDFVEGRIDELPTWITEPWLVGTGDQIVEKIAHLKTLGVDHLMLWFMDAPDQDGMEYFMHQVMPRVR